jgi:hypothetical protein
MSEYKFENCVVTVYDFKNMVIPAGATINIYGSGFKVSASSQSQEKAVVVQESQEPVTVAQDHQETQTNNSEEYLVDNLKAVIDNKDAKKEFLEAISNEVADGKVKGAFCFDLNDYADFDYWLTTISKQFLSNRDKYSIAQFAKDFNISAV